jgi:hypothetical protein
VVVESRAGSPVVPAPGGHLGGAAGLFLALFVASFVVYAVALALVRRGARFTHVFVLACVIQLAPLAGPVFLSSDAWTYWSYARVHDPYSNTPSDDRVAARYAGTKYLHDTSPYGPAFSLVSRPVGLTTSASLAAWLFRAAAALCVLATTWLVARRRAFAAALVGWNPLVAMQFAGGGHNDALMMVLVAAALVLGERKRVQAAGAAWALAVLVKWVPLLLLPLRALEARATGRRVGHIGFAATVVATLGLATLLWQFHWLRSVTPLAHDAQIDTHYALPHRLGVPPWTFLVAYGVAYVWLLREAARGRARLGLAFGLLMVAVPDPGWYVIWPLALSAWDDDDAATLLSLGLCAYLLPQRLT